MVLLHFEAVDWAAKVFVDGELVATHEGGYDPFFVDVSNLAEDRGASHEIVVGNYDPSDSGPQPRGKQKSGRIESPFGVDYTCSSGIWQSVWLESPPTDRYVIPDSLRFTPLSTLDGVSIDVVDRHDPDLSLRLTVRGEDTTLVVALEDLPATLRVRGPAKLWSPDDPHLYDVDAELVDEDGRVLDAFST